MNFTNENKNVRNVKMDCSILFFFIDKLEDIAPVKKKTFRCPYCSDNFQSLKQYVCHKKTHQVTSKVLMKFKCPVCSYTGCGRENLISHYRSDHFFTIKNECLKFNRIEDFQSWKSRIEEESYSSFVKMYGSKKATNCTTINYNCHRSGEFIFLIHSYWHLRRLINLGYLIFFFCFFRCI